MYKITKLKLIVSLILSLLIYASNVAAKDCYEKSPNLIAKQDADYNLEAIKTLSDDEKDKLTNIYRNIEGTWKGESVEIDCRGPDRNPVKKYKNSTVVTDIKLNSDGNLKIRADTYYIEDKVTRLKNLKLLGDSNIYELEFISDNNFFFSERYRRSDPKFSRLVETIYEIKLNRNSLLILRSYYTNGVYTGEERWTLNGV